jgi:hypothetical protein
MSGFSLLALPLGGLMPKDLGRGFRGVGGEDTKIGTQIFDQERDLKVAKCANPYCLNKGNQS